MNNPAPGLRIPGATLDDLSDDLLWPRVLRAPAMALSPSRLLTGGIGAFLLVLFIRLIELVLPASQNHEHTAEQIASPLTDLLTGLINSLMNLDPTGLFMNINLAARLLRDTVMGNPLGSLLIGLPVIAILALCGGSISRSTAFEFAQGRFPSSDETLGFTLRRARQFVGAVVGPILFCALVFLMIAIGGLLLSVPVIDLLGAILYGLGLIVGILATLVLMLHVVALPMIVPALAVEGTDGFDAVQRAYAYTIGKPLRYLSYLALLLLLGSLAAVIFTLLASASIEMTDWATQFFANDATSRVLVGEGELGATQGYAHQIVQFWRLLLELFAAAYFISLFFTSSTLLYLVMRRICDGQDVNEIWEPVQD